MVCNAQSVIRLLKTCPSPVHVLQDDSIERGIVAGRIKLHLVGTGDDAALMAYEIIGKEFVIVGLKNIKTKNSVDLTHAATASGLKLGRENGCEFIRFHTFRVGLVRKALDTGYLPTEFILRKKIE